jgi:TatD DNase family protein
MNGAMNANQPGDAAGNASLIPHPSSFFDTHAHLDQEDFDADRGAVIAGCRRAGVEMVLCVGVSAASSRAACELAEQFGLLAAVGIHPNSTAEALPRDWNEIAALAGRSGVVALGETGLDRYRDFAPLATQQEYLDRHLRLSRETGLPVVIHCRDAQSDLLPMLRAAAAAGPLRGVLHAFSGEADFAAECLSLGLYLSFAGNVTYSNKKFEPLRAVAAGVPEDRLLLETDSPYLVPQTLRGRQRRNEPACVVYTAECLARLRGVSLERVAAATTANARRLFRLLERPL